MRNAGRKRPWRAALHNLAEFRRHALRAMRFGVRNGSSAFGDQSRAFAPNRTKSHQIGHDKSFSANGRAGWRPEPAIFAHPGRDAAARTADAAPPLPKTDLRPQAENLKIKA